MTPQILLNNLRHSFFKLSMIKVLVVDECHHARGSHPYACIMSVSVNMNVSFSFWSFVSGTGFYFYRWYMSVICLFCRSKCFTCCLGSSSLSSNEKLTYSLLSHLFRNFCLYMRLLHFKHFDYLQEFYHRQLRSDETNLPRILGMTASPIKSKGIIPWYIFFSLQELLSTWLFISYAFYCSKCLTIQGLVFSPSLI